MAESAMAEKTPIQYEVGGTLDYQLFLIAATNVPAARHRYDFQVWVENEKWLIRTAPVGEAEMFYESAFDGHHLYEYRFLTCATNSPFGFNGSATIQKSDVPRAGASMANYVWLAFASGMALAGSTNNQLRPLWRLDDPLLVREGFRVHCNWEVSSSRPGLPKWLEMHDDGTLRWRDGSGRRFSEPRAAPFGNGYSRLRYRAIVLTNFNGLVLPESARISVFDPSPTAITTNDLFEAVRVQIDSITFRRGPSPQLMSDLRGTTHIDDERFARPDAGVHVLRYTTTNSTWPAADDRQLTAMASQEARRLRVRPKPDSVSRPKWPVLFLFISSTALLFILYRRFDGTKG
jgi:hypothetical protein